MHQPYRLFTVLVCCLLCASATYKAFTKPKVELTEDIQFELLLEQIARDYGQSIDADILEFYHDRPIRRSPDNIDKIASLPLIDLPTAHAVATNPSMPFKDIALALSLSPIQQAILVNTVQENLQQPSKNQAPSQTDVAESENNMTISYRLRSRLDIEEKKGFRDSTYLGDPIDYYQRLTVGISGITASIITSKDAGELAYSDFISGGLEYKSENYGVLLGDYVREWGQGAMNWRTFGSRKGGETTSAPIRSGNRYRMNTSSIPDGIMRGLTAFSIINTGDSAAINTSIWYSNQMLDGNIDSDSTVSSIVHTGYRRTKLDLEKQDAVEERIIGASSQFQANSFNFGVALQNIKYGNPLNTGNASYFSGTSKSFISLVAGVDITENISTNAEIVYSEGESAAVSTLSYATRDHKLVSSLRYMSKNYLNPYANPFSEFSGSADEIGLYLGYLYRINKKSTLSTFIDFFRSSTARSTSNLPVNGWDWLSQLRVLPNRGNEIIIRGRIENRMDKLNIGKNMPVDHDFYRISARVDYLKRVGKHFRLRLRGEYSALKVISYTANSEGLLASAELDYNITDNFKIGTRHTIFSTDDFNSAMWQYEYVFSGYSTTPVLFGKGSRTTIESRFDFTSALRLSVRYALDFKRGDKPFGAGGESINGNQRSNIVFQLDYDI